MAKRWWNRDWSVCFKFLKPEEEETSTFWEVLLDSMVLAIYWENNIGKCDYGHETLLSKLSIIFYICMLCSMLSKIFYQIALNLSRINGLKIFYNIAGTSKSLCAVKITRDFRFVSNCNVYDRTDRFNFWLWTQHFGILWSKRKLPGRLYTYFNSFISTDYILGMVPRLELECFMFLKPEGQMTIF